MDGNAPRRGGSTARTLAIGAAVVVLVGIVAVASTGSVPTGAGGSARRPSEGFVDTAFSLFLVLMVVCTVFVAVALSFFRRYDPTTGAPKRRSALRSIVSFTLSLVLLAVIVRAVAGARGENGGLRLPVREWRGGIAWGRLRRDALRAGVRGVAGRRGPDAPRGRRARDVAVGPPEAGGAAPSVALTPAEALSDVLGETLDDLRAESDPRRAVIAAYARMERALAAAGLSRRDAEAPEEYLDRVLDEVELSPRAAGRLTALFAWARFSVHDVRPEMKDEAIETLEQVQQELAAAEAAREAQLAEALA